MSTGEAIIELHAEIERLKARLSADVHHGRTLLKPIESLKSCPFDGGKHLVVIKTERYDIANHPEWADDPDAYAYNVHCITCAADGPWKKSQSGCERFWNGIPGTERGGPLP